MASYKGDKGDDQSMCMVKPGPGYINCLAGSIVDSYIAENSGLVQAEGQHRGTKNIYLACGQGHSIPGQGALTHQADQRVIVKINWATLHGGYKEEVEFKGEFNDVKKRESKLCFDSIGHRPMQPLIG